MVCCDWCWSSTARPFCRLSPTIGYLHTGIEKTTEQKKWQQVIPLVERMDYLSAQSNSMAFCLSVERLLGIEVPDRVRNDSCADRGTATHQQSSGVARRRTAWRSAPSR